MNDDPIKPRTVPTFVAAHQAVIDQLHQKLAAMMPPGEASALDGPIAAYKKCLDDFGDQTDAIVGNHDR